VLQSCEQVVCAGDLIVTCVALDKWSLTIRCHTPSCALYSGKMKPAKPWPLPPSPLLPSFPLLPCTPPLPAPSLAQFVSASRSKSNALWREVSALLNHSYLPLVFSSSHLPHFTLFFV